jgi:hypothetical protein
MTEYGFRNYESSDYELIKEWNDKVGVETIAEELLPSKGVVVFNSTGDVCAAQLLTTGQGLAFLLVYLNPDYSLYNQIVDDTLGVMMRWVKRQCLSVRIRKVLIARARTLRNKGDRYSFKKLLTTAGFEEMGNTGYYYKNIY